MSALLAIKVKPRAARDAVIVDGARVRVEVRAAPERGKANESVLRTIAKFLGVPASSVELVSGGASRDKRVRIEGLTDEELKAKLGVLL